MKKTLKRLTDFINEETRKFEEAGVYASLCNIAKEAAGVIK